VSELWQLVAKQVERVLDNYAKHLMSRAELNAKHLRAIHGGGYGH